MKPHPVLGLAVPALLVSGCGGAMSSAPVAGVDSSARPTAAASSTATPRTSPSATSVPAATVTRTVVVTPSVTPAAPSTTRTARPEAEMQQLSVTVHTAAEVREKLAGTSSSFRAAVAGELRQEQALASAECPARIDVIYYWADDQAVGGSGSCGGAVRLWWRENGTGGWQHFDTQNVFYCAKLHEMGVPERMPSSTNFGCYDEVTGGEEDYAPRR